MSVVTVRDFVYRDIPAFLKDIAPEDKMEMVLATNLLPEQALTISIREGVEALCMEADGKIIAVGGIMPTPYPMTYMPWMLCTKAYAENRLAGYKALKKIDQRWTESYPCLINKAWSGNESHIKIIKAFGYTLEDTMDAKGFITFYRST